MAQQEDEAGYSVWSKLLPWEAVVKLKTLLEGEGRSGN